MRVISRFALAIVLLTGTVTSLHAAPLDNPNYVEFEKIFNAWSAAFNNKDLNKSCALFSKNVIADYQGAPQKDYKSICDGFATVFKKPGQTYTYQFTLHNVYRAEDLAVARITWYLKISEKDKLLSTVQDEAIDILREEKPGEWKIISFVGYPTTKE